MVSAAITCLPGDAGKEGGWWRCCLLVVAYFFPPYVVFNHGWPRQLPFLSTSLFPCTELAILGFSPELGVVLGGKAWKCSCVPCPAGQTVSLKVGQLRVVVAGEQWPQACQFSECMGSVAISFLTFWSSPDHLQCPDACIDWWECWRGTCNFWAMMLFCGFMNREDLCPRGNV